MICAASPVKTLVRLRWTRADREEIDQGESHASGIFYVVHMSTACTGGRLANDSYIRKQLRVGPS